jgi:hypothetical protein
VAMSVKRFKGRDYFAAEGNDPRERAVGVDQVAR